MQAGTESGIVRTAWRHHDEKRLLLFWGMRKHGENIIGNRNYYCGYFMFFLFKGGYLPLIDDDSYFTTYNAWFLFFLSMSIFAFIVDICLHKICRDIATCLKEIEEKTD